MDLFEYVLGFSLLLMSVNLGFSAMLYPNSSKWVWSVPTDNECCGNNFVLLLDVSARLVVRNLSWFGTVFIIFGPNIEVAC